jgi:MFS family permease
MWLPKTAARAEPEDDITRHAVARGSATKQAARTPFREVFAVQEFRALWLAQLLSVVGDQLARVALTVLVYDRTHSALLAAATFVVSIVPTFIGGLTLAWLADRYPRRSVMIVCDLIRGVLVLVMALPGMPLAAMVALLFVVTLAEAPFSSARAAIFPDVLSGDRYVLGTAVTLTTYQFAQVLGFGVGGTLVGVFGTRTSLAIDAATFAGSALIVRAWVRSRPAQAAGRRLERSRLTDIFAGTRIVLARPALRTPMLFGLLAAFYSAPEGVAAPLAHALGGGAAAVGVILAANCLGQTVGAITFSRFVAPATRLRFMGPLAVCACAVLVLFFAEPGLSASLLILAASGLCASYQLAANAAFVSAAPQEQRSQAFGVAQAAMSLGQGVVMILAGAAAEHYPPARDIAVFGAVGAVAALALAVSAARSREPTDERAPSARLAVRSTWCRASRCSFVRSGGWLAAESGSRPLGVAHGGFLSSRLAGGWRDGLAQVHLVSRIAMLLSYGLGVAESGSGPLGVAHGGTPFSEAGRCQGRARGAEKGVRL